MDYLKIAYDRLQYPLKQFIAGNKPDWLVVDVTPHWVVEIGEENDIPLINFSVFSSPAEFKLSKDLIFEIAYGLELSGLPFLWVLRKPEWANSDSDALPDGFSDRVNDEGIVSVGWAPQMEILGHSSIGGALFHSGWGSIIEMLQFGHCLVFLPSILDQPLNARFLVEKGLGVEVERNEEDGSFTGDGICKALRLAMASEELRARASEAAGTFGDEKLQYEYYIAKFVQFLKTEVYEN